MKSKLIILILSTTMIMAFGSAGAFWPFDNLKNNSCLSIDQVSHKWSVIDEYPLNVTIYLRNTCDKTIAGDVVFKAVLDKAGLEEEYIKMMIAEYGEKGIKTYIKNNPSSPNLKAISNYMNRGNKLAQNSNYEPVVGSTSNNIKYFFKFKKNVNLLSGEIINFVHSQVLPPHRYGNLLSVEIEKNK